MSQLRNRVNACGALGAHGRNGLGVPESVLARRVPTRLLQGRCCETAALGPQYILYGTWTLRALAAKNGTEKARSASQGPRFFSICWSCIWGSSLLRAVNYRPGQRG